MLRGIDGLPLFEPNVFAIAELRARNSAAATIQQALRAVAVLQMFLDRLDIDLDARVAQGRLLELGEIEELTRQCQWALVEAMEQSSKDLPSGRPSRVVRLEQVRMSQAAQAPSKQVDAGTAAIRLHYIREYLGWLTTNRLLKLDGKHATYAALQSARATVLEALHARIPGGSSRNVVTGRQGLSADELQRLAAVIDPASSDNPWRDSEGRERNELMVRLFVGLGVRRGELAGIKVSDINFRTNELLIARRADDPSDPRVLQPNVKTADKLLALDEDLAVRLQRYILGARRKRASARKHEYLFVATDSGMPLTLDAINKVFVALRRKCPGLPSDLSPHVLRHTWNDDFSEAADSSGMSPETEKRVRSRLMGWSPTSEMASTYTKRHTQRKAKEAVLGLQKKLTKGGKE